MKQDNPLYLYQLEDEAITSILTLDSSSLDLYLNNLIMRFYPQHVTNKEYSNKLKESYKASFVLENIFRKNEIFYKNYSAIYTPTGLIRELINDLYALNSEKVAIN